MENARSLPWEFDGETVAIETPEQTTIEYRIAPLGSRFAAVFLDQLVILVLSVVLICFGLLFNVGAIIGSRQGIAYTLAVVLVGLFLLQLFYFVWGEVRGEGQTWGKRRLGIRSILATGHGMTLGAALIRNLARVVDSMPILWIVPLLSRGKRRIGDFLAGTLVIVAEGGPAEAPVEEWPAASYRELEDRRFYFSAQVAAKLYRDDLNLIEYLESRLRMTPPGRRRKAAADVAERYIDRLGLEEDRERILEDPRRFLQEMGLFLRDRFEGEAY